MKQENQVGAGFIVKRRVMNLFGQGLVGIALLMGGMVCAQQRVEYQIPLHDPVKPNEPAIDFRVELILDADGFPLEYRLPLFTGVCLDGQCNPLQADLFWDALGNYTRLEDDDALLTKGDHKPFTDSDYDRLDQILKDRWSILGTHPLDYFLVKPADRSKLEVDGITAATPLSVKDAVVDQAAYTSWALWHWVNGSIVDRLHAETVARVDDDYLLHGLKSDERTLVGFALEQFLERSQKSEGPWSKVTHPGDNPDDLRPSTLRPLTPVFKDACFHIMENSSRTNCELALELLTESSVDPVEVQGRLIALIGRNGGSSRLILSYFERLPDPDPVVWVELAKQLKAITGYRDLDAAFALLEKHASGLPEVRASVAPLADSEDRFVARRAEEFMATQKDR
jgi:hypothetical protein